MPNKTDLIDKVVMVKLASNKHWFQAVIIGIEEDGYWISGADFISALDESGGNLPAGFASGVMFVPSYRLDWILAARPKP